MSKLGCTCGHIIRDQTNSLPYKAEFIPDKLSGTLYEGAVSNLAGLIQAIREGRQEAWIAAYFTPAYARLKLKDEAIIADVFDRWHLEYYRTMYQCENCGRLWLQKAETNHYESFLPESDEAKGILDA